MRVIGPAIRVSDESLQHYPYVFYYLVEESAVVVIAVRHGARNTNPADLAPD